MTSDQIILFALLFLVFVCLIWGRWRYDLVAFGALVLGLVAGVVPVEQAFAGFGHPATVIVALVLIVSRGLSDAGAIDMLADYVVDKSRSVGAHIGVLAGLGAVMSAIMNNVAALALLMPIDVQAATRAKRSPALTLMPLSFATILGGMVTLIGTPPNIIIAASRQQYLGEPYGMFDFAPVGGVCAAAGLLFIMTVGWRLIPAERGKHDSTQELAKLEDYVAEVRVPADSPVIGKKVGELDELADRFECAVLGLVRRGARLPGGARRIAIQAGDTLVVEAGPENIGRLAAELDLTYAGADSKAAHWEKHDLGLLEVVAPSGARVVGRSAFSLRLLYRHGVNLLGVSRQGKRFRERVRKLEIEAGDVLLLLGPATNLPDVASWLGCLPLAERRLVQGGRGRTWLAVGIFAGAITLASIGVLYLPVALAAAAALMVAFNIVPLRRVYEAVEWPVIVLLGSMIPIGTALEVSGGTALIAERIVLLAAGYSPVVVLILLMVVTMTLSDVMNNTATAVIGAPIAVDVAQRLSVNVDPFLMAVAVAASCAFLTPIGHKNNTLVMGPGGYRFGDYWRMGLPLEVIVIAVGVPMILWIWPL